MQVNLWGMILNIQLILKKHCYAQDFAVKQLQSQQTKKKSKYY